MKKLISSYFFVITILCMHALTTAQGVPPAYVPDMPQPLGAAPEYRPPLSAVKHIEDQGQEQAVADLDQALAPTTPTTPATRQVGESKAEVSDIRQEKLKDDPLPELLRTSEQGFDIEAKRKAVIRLVEEGAQFLSQNSLDHTFNAFSHGEQFRRGELYIFVYDVKGNCLAHGQEENLIWQNLWDLKDAYNTPLVQLIIETAQNGGGWVAYEWRGATKRSYVKEVVKNGKSYFIGAGYYPHSKADAVVSLVTGAVSHFNTVVRTYGRAPEYAFSAFSYPEGQFVQGDLYLYAMDYNGVQVVQGDRPGLVGMNVLNYQDAHGVYVNKVIMQKLKDAPGRGVWVQYTSRNAPKVAYAKEVVDNKGVHYFIACGYYPTANRDQAVDLVKRGYDYMKGHGKSLSVNAFSDRNNDNYRFGDLYLFVYDYKGNVVAHGGNSALIGSNEWDKQDSDGNYYVRDMIQKAQAGGGWINYRARNSFESVYVEPIELGLEHYLIGSGLFPISKLETTLLLVRSGAGFLKTRPRIEALREFTRKGGSFIRGDLFLFVYDPSGITLAYGDEYDLIWRNLIDARDDFGKRYVRLLISAVRRGPARITYTINGAKRVVYAEQAEHNGNIYIVGSGYFL